MREAAAKVVRCLATVLSAGTSAALFLASMDASAAALYPCRDARGGIEYKDSPCAGTDVAAMPVDRATAASPSPNAGARPATASAHRLTPAERERVARLRRGDSGASDELRTAIEIEIAAIREGADEKLSDPDRARLDTLRTRLAHSDREVRSEALAQWRALYARYRGRAHSRLRLLPPTFGAEPGTGTTPEPPLGASVPGTRGPLVAAPPPPPTSTLRTGPIADPATGRVLAPAGNDRAIDPLTGTLWMRSGRVYVDPLSGRIIPAP